MKFKDVLRSVSSNTSMIIPRSWQTWTSIFTLGGNLWEWISSNKIKYTKNCNIKIPIPTQKGLLLTIEAAMKENVSRGRRGGSFTSSYLRSSFSSSKISPSFKDQGKLMEWWVSRRVCPDQPLPLDVKNVLVRTLSSSVLMIEVRQCRGVFDDLRYCWVIDSSRGAVTYSRADTFILVPMIEGLLYDGRDVFDDLISCCLWEDSVPRDECSLPFILLLNIHCFLNCLRTYTAQSRICPGNKNPMKYDAIRTIIQASKLQKVFIF